MKGWVMTVTGPDASGQGLRKRILAVVAETADEAFAAARTAVPGGTPQSIGPLTADSTADLKLTSGNSRVLGSF
jgi:hypothetical protein